MAKGWGRGYRSRMPKWKLDKAKEMRSHLNASESLVWDMLRSRRTGVKFRSQHPMLGYILDFWCPSLRLIIEVDGPMHDPEYDEQRDLHIHRGVEGVTILRIPTSELWADRKAVNRQIVEAVQALIRSQG